MWWWDSSNDSIFTRLLAISSLHPLCITYVDTLHWLAVMVWDVTLRSDCPISSSPSSLSSSPFLVHVDLKLKMSPVGWLSLLCQLRRNLRQWQRVEFRHKGENAAFHLLVNDFISISSITRLRWQCTWGWLRWVHGFLETSFLKQFIIVAGLTLLRNVLRNPKAYRRYGLQVSNGFPLSTCRMRCLRSFLH